MFCVTFVIPCFNERDWISSTLASLQASMKYTVLQKNQVHAVLVVNHPKNACDQSLQNNSDTLIYLNTLKSQLNITLHILNSEQFLTHGVGQARKIGMDYASKNILPNGKQSYIISLDADTRVNIDFLDQLIRLPSQLAWTCYFEHPALKLNNSAEDNSIRYYELYLRYLAQGLNYAESVYTYVPMGSIFGLRKDQYIKSGGMVQKDATEDFHYLNKLRKTGAINYISQLKVMPAARKSTRVYLGTGFYLTQNDQSLWIPKVKAFEELKQLLNAIENYWVDKTLNHLQLLNYKQKTFLQKLDTKLNKQIKNCSSELAFKKRIPQSFDALEQMRFLKLSSYQYNTSLNKPLLRQACLLKGIENKGLNQVLNFYRRLKY